MILSPYLQPVSEPVGLTEMKLHLKVDDTADDELIKTLITSARQWAESYEGQSYQIRSYKLYLDRFYSCIQLPMPPLISVDSITYIDTAGTEQTLSTDIYVVDSDSIPARIYRAYNKSWPETRCQPKAVTITFTCGYSTTFVSTSVSNILTVGNTVFANGDIVRVYSDGNDLPSPLATNTNYYVRDVSGSTLKLATSLNGTAIDITDDGTGTHYIAFAARGFVPDRVRAAIKLIVAHLYEHREEISEINLSVIPFSAKNLLMERVF